MKTVALITIVVLSLQPQAKGSIRSTLELQLSVSAGETVILPCRAREKPDVSVDWRYHWSPLDAPALVYSNHRMYDTIPSRIAVVPTTATTAGGRDYSLAINGAQPNDTGLYTCVENGGYGRKHTISLIVTDVQQADSEAQTCVSHVTEIIVLAVLLGVAVVVMVTALVVVCLRYHDTRTRGRGRLAEKSGEGNATENDAGIPLNPQQLSSESLDTDKEAASPDTATDPEGDNTTDTSSIPPVYSPMKTTGRRREHVRGICVSGDLLYVVRDQKAAVEVYDRQTLHHVRDFGVADDPHPGCMTFCAANNCLYIAYYRSRTILRVHKDTQKIEKSWQAYSEPDGISAIPDSTNVVVALRKAHSLVVYKQDGTVVAQINLPPNITPRFAVAASLSAAAGGGSGYLVCHGEHDQPDCGVIFVAAEGNVIRPVQTGTVHPLHLAFDGGGRGFVLVADYSGNKVAVLDANFNHVGDAIAAGAGGLRTPLRLCCSDDVPAALYVGERGGDCRVLSYSVDYATKSSVRAQ